MQSVTLQSMGGAPRQVKKAKQSPLVAIPATFAVLGLLYTFGVIGVVFWPGLVREYLLPNPSLLWWFMVVTLLATPTLGNAFVGFVGRLINGKSWKEMLRAQFQNLWVLGTGVELANWISQTWSKDLQRWINMNTVVLGTTTNVISFLEGLQMKQVVFNPSSKVITRFVVWVLLPLMALGVVFNGLMVGGDLQFADGAIVIIWALLPQCYNLLTVFAIGWVRARRSVRALQEVQQLYHKYSGDTAQIRVEIERRLSPSHLALYLYQKYGGGVERASVEIAKLNLGKDLLEAVNSVHALYQEIASSLKQERDESSAYFDHVCSKVRERLGHQCKARDKMWYAFALDTLEMCRKEHNYDYEVVHVSRYATKHLLQNTSFLVVSSIVSSIFSSWMVLLFKDNHDPLIPLTLANWLASNIVNRATSYPLSGLGVVLSVGLGEKLFQTPLVENVRTYVYSLRVDSQEQRARLISLKRQIQIILKGTGESSSVLFVHLISDVYGLVRELALQASWKPRAVTFSELVELVDGLLDLGKLIQWDINWEDQQMVREIILLLRTAEPEASAGATSNSLQLRLRRWQKVSSLDEDPQLSVVCTKTLARIRRMEAYLHQMLAMENDQEKQKSKLLSFAQLSARLHSRYGSEDSLSERDTLAIVRQLHAIKNRKAAKRLIHSYIAATNDADAVKALMSGLYPAGSLKLVPSQKHKQTISKRTTQDKLLTLQGYHQHLHQERFVDDDDVTQLQPVISKRIVSAV